MAMPQPQGHSYLCQKEFCTKRGFGSEGEKGLFTPCLDWRGIRVGREAMQK